MIAVTFEFRKKISHIAILLATFIFAAPVQSTEITATLPPLAGLIQLLDQESEIVCLLPAGSDPHHFQLSPRQVEKLKQATLLIRSSKDDRGWLKLGKETPAIDLWPEQDHAWLNPHNVENMLPRLAETLISAMPEKKSQIMGNLKTAQARVATINEALEKALQRLQTKGVIMQHPSWRGVFKAFDIPVLATLESPRHGHEHGPRHLEEALATLHNNPAAVLIGDMRHSNRSLEWLSDHADKKTVLYLDALGNCGEDWMTLMQQNIDRINKP